MSAAATAARLLFRAAEKLREHAEAASAGPWEAHPDGLVWAERIGDPVSGSTEAEDGNYIALMHPPVAMALADLLERLARLAEVQRSEVDDRLFAYGVYVAREILRREES